MNNVGTPSLLILYGELIVLLMGIVDEVEEGESKELPGGEVGVLLSIQIASEDQLMMDRAKLSGILLASRHEGRNLVGVG